MFKIIISKEYAMRIFNITLLLNSLKNNKNTKQFLLFINIGIFLSIFAISSAVITFYTETKIDSIEFDLITEHNDKKYFDDTLDSFAELRNTLYSQTKHESDMISLYQHSASTKLGSKLLSINDIYLPIVFIDLNSEDSKYFKMFFEEYEGINFLDQVIEAVNLFYESDDWLPKELDITINAVRKHKDLFNKDYSKYYDKIFNYNFSSILNEVYYENNGIIDTDNQIYIDYYEMREFGEELDNLFYLLEIYFTDISSNSQALINDYNEKIIKLSKRENNIIIIAFFLQLIIFCIIQYFEINSIQQARKKNA
ncbi:hypothetical protein N8729_02580 [Candidatus Pelagibacter sp.]|nr:hypothetical protein [Candidatus Pelagibacter sp.]